METDPSRRRWASLLLRVGVVGVIVLWLFTGADLGKLTEALGGISVAALGVALGCGALNMGVAGVRWRWLMRAFGAAPLPPATTLARLHLVGMFYNTFVPGAVGGDVVRGVVSRQHFSHGVASFVVVLLERLIGLSALGVVFLGALVAGPELVDTRALAPWVAGLIGIGVVALIGARLSGRLSQWVALVPPVRRWSDLVRAFAISLVGHGLNVTIYVSIARGLGLPVGLLDLAVVVPIALVASAVPVAIAALGPREAVVVALLAPLGVERTGALALSLGYWAVLVSLAAAGGLVQLVGGGRATDLGTTESSAAGPPPS